MSITLTAAQWLELFMHFASLSLLAVGGAITTTPDMQRFLVVEQGWLDAEQFSKSIALARRAGVWLSPWNTARSSSVPVRSSFSVKTCLVPALNASLLTQPKFLPAQTTTAGSALPMKYSISAAW